MIASAGSHRLTTSWPDVWAEVVLQGGLREWKHPGAGIRQDVPKGKSPSRGFGRDSLLQRRSGVSGGIYKVVELVGTSTESWEAAARTAIEGAAESLEDIRIAEVVKMDVRMEKNKIIEFRTRVALSFKYHKELRA
jgi:flavin-binding protein dodecin